MDDFSMTACEYTEMLNETGRDIAVTIKVGENTHKSLKKIAEAYDISLSKTMRTALDYYVIQMSDVAKRVMVGKDAAKK